MGFIEDEVATGKIDTLERIAAALAVDPGWLCYGHEAWEPFRERRPRDVLPPDFPEPSRPFHLYRARYRGFADRLQQARAASGLSMRELSRAAGVSVQTWSNNEHGKGVPRVDIVERMAVALDVAPAWLAFGELDTSADPPPKVTDLRPFP